MTPVGVVLAGGAGRRLGGQKAAALLDGVPLVTRTLAILAAVTETQAVVAKADTQLPATEHEVWIEPDHPRHPAAGIAHALERADGRAVLCIAVDLPLLDAATLRRLLAADDGHSACVVACVDGRLEPLCALWRPAAAGVLAAADGRSMRELLTLLRPQEVDVGDPTRFLNVNTPPELAQAEQRLRDGPGPA